MRASLLAASWFSRWDRRSSRAAILWSVYYSENYQRPVWICTSVTMWCIASHLTTLSNWNRFFEIWVSLKNELIKKADCPDFYCSTLLSWDFLVFFLSMCRCPQACRSWTQFWLPFVHATAKQVGSNKNPWTAGTCCKQILKFPLHTTKLDMV